jgi:transcriptional regulator with XRE-family HTH domain
MKLSREKAKKNIVVPSEVVTRLRHWANLTDDASWAYKLATMTNIGASTLQKYARNEGGISLGNIFSACERLNLDPVWLLFGPEAIAISPETHQKYEIMQNPIRAVKEPTSPVGR